MICFCYTFGSCLCVFVFGARIKSNCWARIESNCGLRHYFLLSICDRHVLNMFFDAVVAATIHTKKTFAFAHRFFLHKSFFFLLRLQSKQIYFFGRINENRKHFCHITLCLPQKTQFSLFEYYFSNIFNKELAMQNYS